MLMRSGLQVEVTGVGDYLPTSYRPPDALVKRLILQLHSTFAIDKKNCVNASPRRCLEEGVG